MALKPSRFLFFFFFLFVWILPKQHCVATNRVFEKDPSYQAKHAQLLRKLGSYDYESRNNGRSLVEHLNDNNKGDEESGSSSASSRQGWTITLSKEPVWMCHLGFDICKQQVQQEQEQVITHIQSKYPSVTVLGQVQKIYNTIHIELPTHPDMTTYLSNIPGVQRVSMQQQYTVEIEQAIEGIGATWAQSYCLTGEGSTVGVLDTGVDYTHIAFGGEGTPQAYLDAYGVDKDSIENTQRDGLFPTSIVVDGKDFLGEDETIVQPDDDPIDASGHGTAVASAILAVAPNAKIVAAKSCTSTVPSTCPDHALLEGIEFLLDPNGDGSIDDKVDVINLSVSIPFLRPYHDHLSLSLENAAQLGVICVTAFGNSGNIPYIAGSMGTTPNVIAVGATSTPTEESPSRYMEGYSSRGPGETNFLKPDISAPGNLTLALAGGGTAYTLQAGTSFSAPMVAGAAALLRQYCPSCEPLAIKCLLMNSADPNVLYSGDSDETRMAPVTRMGSGMLRVDKALNATLWAFSLEERQPSLTFGVVDAWSDIQYYKTIQIRAIDSRARTIHLDHVFRNASKAEVVTVTFDPPVIEMPANCNATVNVQVSFYVHANLAPPNTMTTSGNVGLDPEALDRHEFDGHIRITSAIDQEAILPFHMLVRQAAAPRLALGSALPSTWGPIDQDFTIFNDGVGIAQIDAYELIYSDMDDMEAGYGVERVSSDIRTIGYRTVPVGEPGCDYTVEFSFQTWERFTHVGHQLLMAEIFPEDTNELVTLFIPMFPGISQSYIFYDATNTSKCTGFPSDHSSNTANTVMRACSDDLLLNEAQNFTVQFRSFAYPLEFSTDFLSSQVKLSFPNQRLSAPSYDIGPLETLREFHVTGEISQESFGLQLVTNAFRDWERTGAASATTETILLVKQGIVLEQELTVDDVIWPGLFNQTGPVCGLALPMEPTCDIPSLPAFSVLSSQQDLLDLDDMNLTESPNCEPAEVPRLTVPTTAPTTQPSVPTLLPDPGPTLPPRVPTAAPSLSQFPGATLPSASPDQSSSAQNLNTLHSLTHLLLLLMLCFQY